MPREGGTARCTLLGIEFQRCLTLFSPCLRRPIPQLCQHQGLPPLALIAPVGSSPASSARFFFAAPLAFTKWPHYSATAVCKSCGLRKDFFDWDLRFSKSTIHRFTTESPTAISQALAGHQPAQRHEHDWTAPAALPLTGSEADETPPHLLYTVEAPRVARFAENLATYTNADTQTKWRRAILDPAYAARSSRHRFASCAYPNPGLPMPRGFRSLVAPGAVPSLESAARIDRAGLARYRRGKEKSPG